MILANIGDVCWVPCIYLPHTFHGDTWIPVLGHKHSDADLGVIHVHWHIDWRFASERLLVGCSRNITGQPHGTVIFNDGADYLPTLTGVPEIKRRKCKRAMPDFPARPKGLLFRAMEVTQRDRCNKLVDGHTCPHRGIDLRPFVQADGTAICPGHGLRWDMATGELIPRYAAPV